MTIDPDHVTLRPATPSDLDFVLAVTDASIRPYAEQTFGSWDPLLPCERFDPATYEVIQLRGEDVGCMQVLDEQAHFQLNVLYLLPIHQGRGIGSVLLERLIARSVAAGKPIRLRVLRVNPARRLYERYGFSAYDAAPERFLMERVP